LTLQALEARRVGDEHFDWHSIDANGDPSDGGVIYIQESTLHL